MGRGAQDTKTTLTTSEARKVLPRLARAAAKRARPSKSPRDNAVRIQPRGEARCAYLVPEVDLESAERRIEELEEELEDVALMRLLEERASTDSGKLTPVDDVIAELGFHDLLNENAAS
jgi:hypothetical protein